MQGIAVHSASIIGRDHMARQANCQDSYALSHTESALIGVVCDGCGEGSRSEMGAHLASTFLIEQAQRLLAQGSPLDEIASQLHAHLLDFLLQMVTSIAPTQRTQFIREHLLFTIVGIILTPQGGIIFSAGDGLVVRDEHVHKIEQHNQPHYIAYHLLDAASLGGHIPSQGFELHTFPHEWHRLAISTDGFEPELLPQVWGLKHARGLQRKFNAWSSQDRRFQDDATLIIIEKVEEL